MGEFAPPAAAAQQELPRRSQLVPAAVVSSGVLGAFAATLATQQLNLQPASVHLATGSAGTVMASLAAYLVVRRMKSSHQLVDVFLAAALTLAALGSLALAALAGVDRAAGAVPLRHLIDASLDLIVAAGFALAAFVPARAMADPAREAERYFVTGLALALATVAFISLAVALDPPGTVVVVADGVAVVAWGSAAFGFMRRRPGAVSVRTAWLGIAASLFAVGSLADAFLLSSDHGDAPSGALIQIAAMVALLAGCIRDFERDQQQRAAVAISHERRRLARDLHDGLAQELAYIKAESRRLAGEGSSEHLAEAAERALEESRAAILALSRPADEPLDRLISDTARSMASRGGVDVTVAVRPGIDATAEHRQALVRILREAMTNAIGHGRAGHVRVSVDGPAPLVMAIADDGDGFRLDDCGRPDSIGLQCMRERAENLGGRISIESDLNSGTTVAVVFP